jgi:hypothetical protein
MARKSGLLRQKETQDLLHTHRKKRERRERTLKFLGRERENICDIPQKKCPKDDDNMVVKCI